jgi:hypothetical protein
MNNDDNPKSFRRHTRADGSIHYADPPASIVLETQEIFDLIRTALLRVSATTAGGTFQDTIDKAANMIIYDLKEKGFI